MDSEASGGPDMEGSPLAILAMFFFDVERRKSCGMLGRVVPDVAARTGFVVQNCSLFGRSLAASEVMNGSLAEQCLPCINRDLRSELITLPSRPKVAIVNARTVVDIGLPECTLSFCFRRTHHHCISFIVSHLLAHLS